MDKCFQEFFYTVGWMSLPSLSAVSIIKRDQSTLPGKHEESSLSVMVPNLLIRRIQTIDHIRNQNNDVWIISI